MCIIGKPLSNLRKQSEKYSATISCCNQVGAKYRLVNAILILSAVA
jgi:hypothetical protein